MASFLVVLVVMLVAQYALLGQQIETIGYSQFKTLVKKGQVTDVAVRDKTIGGSIKVDGMKEVFSSEKLKELGDRTKQPLPFVVVRVEDARLTAELEEAGIPFKGETTSDWFPAVLSWVVPVIIFFVLWSFLFKRIGGAGAGLMQIGKSKAKVYIEKQTGVTFADVEGIDEAEEELIEVVEFLKHPEKYQRLGGHLPKGVLLVGPPGTGKTLLARAVAGEAGVPFFSISGSDFVEMFVGVGASRVRDLFEQAKANAPAIVFVVEMDGFDTKSGVILIAGTNRPDILDPALLRPGRFDRQIAVDRPDLKGRVDILRVHARGKPLSGDIDLEVLARRTPGFTGADLANVVNEAALLSARHGRKEIVNEELEEAIDRVIAGPERKTRVISEKEKRVIAYHESGHALVGHALPNTDPVHKVSIISRGRALGWTLALPVEDKFLVTRSEMIDQLAMLLGGRVAEELWFLDPSTGASDDIEKATQLARKMVCEYGMSDRLGSLVLGTKQENVFLGRDFGHQQDYSEQVAFEIDKEMRRLIDEAHVEAEQILTRYRDVADQMVDVLMETETIAKEELAEILAPVVQRPPRGIMAPRAGYAHPNGGRSQSEAGIARSQDTSFPSD